MKESQELIVQLKKLNAKLDKQNSFSYKFFMSIVSGLGSIIGATIVFGILLAIASQTIDRAQDIPAIGEWIENWDIDNVVDNN